MLDQRGQLLRAALGFAALPRPSYDRALHALRSWLDSWHGIGAVESGMARQGYDLQLTWYDENSWWATFYTTGMEHSIATGHDEGIRLCRLGLTRCEVILRVTLNETQDNLRSVLDNAISKIVPRLFRARSNSRSPDEFC